MRRTVRRADEWSFSGRRAACPAGCSRWTDIPSRNKHSAAARWSQLFTCSIHLLVLIVLVAGSRTLRAEEPTAAQKETTGTLAGTITYEADPQRPWRLGRYYIRNAKTGELAEAVVAIYQRRLKGPEVKRPPATATIDQKNFQFIPETVAIRAGDQVRFLNSDDHVHNVKTAHPKLSFNVTMPVASEHTETFAAGSGTERPYQIECVFHASMHAWVFVFDHPWFALTGEDGAFELKGIPPGEYRLDVVHPAGNLRTSEKIRVVSGQKHRVQIDLRPSKKSARR